MQYQVSTRTTSRGEPRLCLCFSEKPPDDLRRIIKDNGGRYRRGAGPGASSLWYIPMASSITLVAALDEISHPLGPLLRPLLAPVAPVAPPVVVAPPPEAPRVLVVEEELPRDDRGSGAARPRKRQRRSARGDGGSCLACQWQLAMLRQTGR